MMVKINQHLFLGEPAMKFLWDFLNHQEGSHGKDHLSLRETNLQKFSKETITVTWHFSVVAFSVQLRHVDEDILVVSFFPGKTMIKALISPAEGCNSQCQPFSQLKTGVVLCCGKRVWIWPLLLLFQELLGKQPG